MNDRLIDSGNFPNVILIDTCSYCNLKCSMCFHDKMQRKKGVMSWELFTKIIDEISIEKKDARVWMIFFGEPFVIKRGKCDIFKMIRYAKDKGLTDVVTNSNGNLMDAEAAANTIKSGLDAIYIGIDAFTKTTYEKYRVGGDYEKTVNNVLTLIDLKKRLQSNTPEIFLQFVEMDGNRQEMQAFIDFWSQYDVTVKIRPMVSWAGKINADGLIKDNAERHPCHWAMQTMSITDQGDVVNCAVDLDAAFVAGNVKEATLKDIWMGALKNNRNMHINNEWDSLPEICRNCRDWQSATSSYVK